MSNVDANNVDQADLSHIQNLLAELRRLLAYQQGQFKMQWNRALPMADYISNRWDKAKDLGFGEGTSAYDSCLVLGDVVVGKHTWIGPFTILDGSGGLVIGDYCSISAGVQIYTHDTVKWALSGGLAKPEHSSVSIGSNCYIGPNAVISKGVTIGDGVTIGACSFVNKDIPSGCRAWGIPARIITDQ